MSGWFSLEAVYAKKGDALILHFGSDKKPCWILIDGGHDKVYDEFLRPRLEELRLRWPERLDRQKRLPLEMVMVSHADADHLQGILDLTAHMQAEDPGRPPAPVTVDKLWFNSFDDITDSPVDPASVAVMDAFAQTASFDEPDDFQVPTAVRTDQDLRAVIASTRQGRRLRQDVEKMAIQVNPEYGGKLIMRGGTHASVTRHSPGLKLTLLSPDRNRVDKLRKKWDKDLKAILKKEGAARKAAAADTASFKDTSVFNLSSIMVLVERGGKSMLLTGDGRGDDLIAGLKAEKRLDANGKIHVDLFKLPHHGSSRNAKVETFRDITAKHYVVSANGEHENPDTDTFDLLVDGRKKTRTDEFSLHLTFPEEAFKLIPEELANKKTKVRKQKDALEHIDTWLKTRKPDNCNVVYRGKDQRSFVVDLGTESVLP